MGKGFLKLIHETKRLSALIFGAGIVLTIILGILSARDARFQTEYKIARPKVGEEPLEQEIIVSLGGEKGIPVKIAVEDVQLSQAEAEQILLEGEQLLHTLVLGENESAEKIMYSLSFPENMQGTLIEIDWISKPLEYVNSDGTLREDMEILEPVSQEISAILNCQTYTRDFSMMITFMPRELSLEKRVERFVQQTEIDSREQKEFKFPTNYGEMNLQWRKPLDVTFVYFFFFILLAVIFLRLAEKRDVHMEKKERQKSLTNEYPQIVSKFAMLLSTGMSVRNAWTRIVAMNKAQGLENTPISQEMNWALRELQKGSSELMVYEQFGSRIGLIHYKKLMALFISDKRRGNRNLLEVLNDEMLQAWEEKRRSAKIQGEQVGTKLLIPMLGMMSVVFVIIIVPAFLTFGI